MKRVISINSFSPPKTCCSWAVGNEAERKRNTYLLQTQTKTCSLVLELTEQRNIYKSVLFIVIFYLRCCVQSNYQAMGGSPSQLTSDIRCNYTVGICLNTKARCYQRVANQIRFAKHPVYQPQKRSLPSIPVAQYFHDETE